MGWIKDKLAQFFAPSFLTPYVGAAVRAVFLAGGTFLISHGAPSEMVNHLLSPENAEAVGAAIVAIALAMSFADKARNQPASAPAGEKVTKVFTAPIASGVVPVKVPSTDPRVL